jgi:SAM-dependent methyltransferase
MLDKSMVGTHQQVRDIEDALRHHYYKDPAFLETDGGAADLAANAWERQARFQKFLTPWVDRVLPLSGMSVADVGCGTGSSTAALCKVAKKVIGYEIDPGSAEVASRRLATLSLSNGSVKTVDPVDTLAKIRSDFPGGVHVLALVAVLEHMTPKERIDFLAEAWDVIAGGGLLVIFETPNRLTYFDYHTSQLPFFDLLPVDLMVRYAGRSSREGFNSLGLSEAEQIRMFRWGAGVSYHEFELTLPVDDISDVLVADGYETETMDCWPVTPEERLLAKYFLEKPIDRPLGFSRDVLNVIFRKPWPGMEKFTLRHDRSWIDRAFAWHGLPEGAVERVLAGRCKE